MAHQIQILGVTVPYSVPESFTVLRSQVLPFIKSTWKKDDIRFEVLKTGYINRTILCHLCDDGDGNDALIIRIYGDLGGGLQCRDLEFAKMQIAHEVGCFAPVLATFENGLVHKYIQGRCMGNEEIGDPLMIQKIATALARFHFADIPSLHLLDRKGKKFLFEMNRGYMYNMKIYLQTMETLLLSSEQEERASHQLDVEEYARELAFVEDYLHDLDLPVVNYHGDFHSSNILHDDRTGDVYFIDYDAGDRVNYAMFDFACILNSYRFKTIADKLDLPSEPETDETRMLWLSSYLREKHRLEGADNCDPTPHELSLWDIHLGIMNALSWFSIAIKLNIANRTKSADINFNVTRFEKLCLAIYYDNKPKMPALKKRYHELLQQQ